MEKITIPCPHHDQPYNMCDCASCRIPVTGGYANGICSVCHGTGVVQKMNVPCPHHDQPYNMCDCASCRILVTGGYANGICKVCKGIGTI